MSAQPVSRVPRFGEEDFLPNRRAMAALPLTVMYWALIFTVVFFATRDFDFEDSVAASGYIGALLITFMMIIFFIIPSALAGGLARLTIEPALRNDKLRNAALTFTGIVVVGSLSIGWAVFTGGL